MRDPNSLTIILQRDSVAAGDDVTAPNEMSLTVDRDATLAQVLALVKQKHYLASIQGGKATWILVVNKKPIAVLAQQWDTPKFLINPSMRITDCIDPHSRLLWFNYYAQSEPERIFDALQAGGSLPDRYLRN